MESDRSVFDAEGFAVLCDHDAEFQREVIGQFLDDLGPRLERISAAVASGDAKAVRETSHALRGSAASLGAASLAEASDKLESLGRDAQLGGSPAMLESVQHEAGRLRAALEALTEDRG
jgi:HPt (histidine-containing phosphotransfer) domain-containing protein